jgi:WD40 repeat protein
MSSMRFLVHTNTHHHGLTNLYPIFFLQGHFGPINAIGINPNGRSYASGGEDGYIRLHHFDQDYLERTDPVPEEEIKIGN